MQKDSTKKNKIKKAITVGGLAIMLGTGSVSLASADSCGNKSDCRHDQSNYQQQCRDHRDNDRDRKDHDKDRRDHKNQKDHKDYREKKMMINGRIVSFRSDKMIVREGRKFYIVKTSDAKFYNKKGEKIDSDEVKSGHMVTVRGTKSAKNTIKAERVRDLSIR